MPMGSNRLSESRKAYSRGNQHMEPAAVASWREYANEINKKLMKKWAKKVNA